MEPVTAPCCSLDYMESRGAPLTCHQYPGQPSGPRVYCLPQQCRYRHHAADRCNICVTTSPCRVHDTLRVLDVVHNIARQLA